MPDSKDMIVVVDGKDTRLTSANFLAAGGEAMLYKVRTIIIKIYHDADKMRRDDMVGKINLLTPFDQDAIVAPKGVVTNKQGKPVGFWMRFVENEPLPRIFTSSFWLRNSFNFMQASHLVSKMRDVVEFVHANGAVMVDPNEVNWLVDLKAKNGPDPIAIDVDSWSIGKWKSHTLMLHIRDYHHHAIDFTPSTDWFSWAVVTFQIYTGIHPYRGMLPGYTDHIDDIIKRMKENKSVFTPNVKLNRAVRDFNEIPKPLLAWYRNTFDNSERSKPPSPYDKQVTVAPSLALVQRVVITTSGQLKFDILFGRVDFSIIRVFPCGVAQAKNGELFDLLSKQQIGIMPTDGELIKVAGGWLTALMNNGSTKFNFIDGDTRELHDIHSVINSTGMFRVGDRLFLLGNNLLEVNFMNVGRPLVSVTQGVKFWSNAQWFDGLGIQDAFGSKFLILPFVDSKGCVVTRVKELDGQIIVSAKAGLQFVTVITIDKQGVYHKYELTFDTLYSTYALWQSPISGPELNIAMLPTRVCATILNDGELVIFVPSNGKVTKIADKQITTDKLLTNWGNKVIYIDNGSVWHVSM